MRIVDLKDPTKEYPLRSPCGLCLGFFDGVHLGHQALIRALVAECKETQRVLPLGALCFTKPPKDYFSDTPTPQLTTLEEKLERLRRCGLRFAVLYDFSEIRDLDAFDFVKDVLILRLNCVLVSCGYNYTFGKNAAGTPDDLVRYFESQPNRRLLTVPRVCVGRETVSSTRIRELLLNGHPERAAPLLGNAYSITGTVRGGRKLGRTIKTPTANLDFPEGKLIPAYGVYTVTVRVGTKTYNGICNVGVRPTVSKRGHVNCESFLFDFEGDLYGKEITVSFLRRMRYEIHFPTLSALQAQQRKDIEKAKRFFRGEWY